jgi:hypothetical protein
MPTLGADLGTLAGVCSPCKGFVGGKGLSLPMLNAKVTLKARAGVFLAI